MTFSKLRYNPQIKLSPKEILEISQEINREFAPKLSIKKQGSTPQHQLSPKEMFEISEEISLSFAPKASNNPKELVLLPVDPNHLYVYWNLDDTKLNSRQKHDAENQLTLRIYKEPTQNAAVTEIKPCFEVAIDNNQAQQKVYLPLRTNGTAYRATIEKRNPNNSLAPLASSNITHVPLGKLLSHQVKDSQIVFNKPMPQLNKVSREIPLFRNISASGQGNP